jgi:RNA polymerase primary sigma factor
MDRNEKKNEFQIKAIMAWIANDCMGIVEACTGFGKTRLGVLAAKGFHNKYGDDFKVLIVTPTKTIRDQAWKDEFTKWKCKKVFNTIVETVCIQTAYKWKGKEFDLVILDEVHNYTGDKYSTFLQNNTLKRIMGLSATLEYEQLDFFRDISLPIVYKVSLETARKEGLVSDYVVYNLGVRLSAGERAEYEEHNRVFGRTFPLFDKDLKLMFKCMNDADFFKDLCRRKGIDYDQVKSFPFQCNRAIAGRKNLIYNCAEKLDAIKDISDLLDDRLAIIFSQTIKSVDKVTSKLGDCCVSFHSKIGKKKREENLKKLMDGRTRVNRISAGKALDEGANIPKCSLAIISSSTSSARTMTQRIGRSIRWEEGKVAIIVRLYVINSQEEKWLQSSQEGQDVKFINTVNEIEI